RLCRNFGADSSKPPRSWSRAGFRKPPVAVATRGASASEIRPSVMVRISTSPIRAKGRTARCMCRPSTSRTRAKRTRRGKNFGSWPVRWPKSRRRGRKQTPSEVTLRLAVLKHVRNWSFEETEREVRANVVYRQFTRIGAQKVPDAKTLGRLLQTLGPDVVQQIHQRLVAVA